MPLTARERRVYFVDAHGVVRLRTSGRKRRSDYGQSKPHPHACQHCRSVELYREVREAHAIARGGWKNEDAYEGAITFKEWLIHCAREQRAIREQECAA